MSSPTISVKVNGNLYPASIDGMMSNYNWDGRESKAITLTATYAEASTLFKDDVAWSIVQTDTVPVYDETTHEPTGATTTATSEFDNKNFSVLGDIVIHSDGTCTVYMGKPTDLEVVLAKQYGG